MNRPAGRRSQINGNPDIWALVISYDGSRFHGFQWQVGQRTVQGELYTAMKRLSLPGDHLVGAGRTDTGVDADRQVVTVETSTVLSADTFRRAMNAVLTNDIKIIWARRAPSWFDARRSVTSRIYRYRIASPEAPHPALNLASWLASGVDIAKWRNQLRSLIGVGDFASLAAKVGRGRKSTVRRIVSSNCWREGGEVVVEIEANGFLTRMVRLIVGGLVKSTRSNDRRSGTSNRDRVPRTINRWPAPANGLTFYGVTTPGLAARRTYR